jgi:hypothetical protein
MKISNSVKLEETHLSRKKYNNATRHTVTYITVLLEIMGECNTTLMFLPDCCSTTFLLVYIHADTFMVYICASTVSMPYTRCFAYKHQPSAINAFSISKGNFSYLIKATVCGFPQNDIYR